MFFFKKRREMEQKAREQAHQAEQERLAKVVREQYQEIEDIRAKMAKERMEAYRQRAKDAHERYAGIYDQPLIKRLIGDGIVYGGGMRYGRMMVDPRGIDHFDANKIWDEIRGFSVAGTTYGVPEKEEELNIQDYM